jgi:hypothetical protein
VEQSPANSSFAAMYLELTGSEVPPLASDQLKKYWTQPVAELCQLRGEEPLSDAARERHRLYSHLLAAIVFHYWNGNKHGRRGEYPWNDLSTPQDPEYLSGDYVGHNIAAIAVDARGRVLDLTSTTMRSSQLGRACRGPLSQASL